MTTTRGQVAGHRLNDLAPYAWMAPRARTNTAAKAANTVSAPSPVGLSVYSLFAAT